MAVSAGTAYLDIVPRLQRNFSRDLTRQMFGPAGQAAERTGQKAGQQFGGAFAKGTRQGAKPVMGVFRQYRGEITALVGAFAAAKVVGFLSDAIAEAREAAKVTRQTNAVIKATGGVANVSAKDVDRLAASLSNKTGVDDEVIAAGQNMLLTFKGVANQAGKNNDIFNQATQVALDMTAALHQGTVTQQGYEKSAIMLGKALNNPLQGLTALQRVGVTFTASQKDQIKTLVESGRTMDAQKIILKELASEFGGAAEAAADPWQKLTVATGNVKESIGTALLPVMLIAVDAAGDLAIKFNDLNEATNGLAAQAAVTAGAVTAIGVVVFKVAKAVGAARTAWVAYRAASLGATAADVLLTRQMILLTGATTASGDAAAVAGSKLAIFGKLSAASLGAFAAAAAAGAYQGHSMAQAFEEARGKNDLWARVLTFSIGGTKKQADATKQTTAETKTYTEWQAKAATDTKQLTQTQYDQEASQKAVADQTQSLTDKLKGLQEEFANQKQAVQQSIEAYDGLVAKSDVTATQVIKDLHNQVANFRTYSADVKRLIKAGVDPKAIQELSTKGPQYIHALATGSKTQLEKYKDEWAAKNKAVKGDFTRSMQSQYEDLVAKIRKMNTEIAKLKGKTVTVAAGARITLEQQTKAALNALGIKGYGVKFLAQGGMVRLGETAIVGEEGPELVQFSRPARVIPNTESKQILERGMASGGIVGGFRDPAVQATTKYGKLAITKYAELFGRELGKVVNGTVLGGQSGPGGWRWQMAVLRNMFPGLPLISGFRPGAITSTGNRSYHAMGRAVDIPPRWDVFNWISAVYGRNTKELIYTPAGSRQIKNGRHHVFSGGTIRQDHYNHIHWAYDKGGWLPPGLSMAYNGTGKPERVLSPREDRMRLHPETIRALAAELRANPPVVAVRDLQQGMNHLAGRFGQARPYR